jgi:hypothetical protein
MGKKIYYKCPHCEKTHLYESKHRYAPKNARTHCKSCHTQIYVKPNFIGAHRNQKVSSSQNWSNPPQTISNVPDKIIPLDSSKSDGCKKSSQTPMKSEIKNLSDGAPVSSASDSTGVSNNHQNCNYDTKKMFSCHCMRFKVDRISEPAGFQWDFIKDMKGWERKIRVFSDYKIEITKNLLIINLSKKIYGNYPKQIEEFGKKYASEIIKYLFTLGFNCSTDINLVQKIHVVLPESIKPEMPGQYLFSTSDGDIVIDDTPHTDSIEIIGLESLEKMAAAPKQIEEMAKIIKMQNEAIANQTKLINQLLGVVDQNVLKEKEREKENGRIYT